MTIVINTPWVVIEDGHVGWHVWLEHDASTTQHDTSTTEYERAFSVRLYAQSYANGLASGNGYAILDRSTYHAEPWHDDCPDACCKIPFLAERGMARAIVVEQLDAQSWYIARRGHDTPVEPWERGTSVIGSWATVAAEAASAGRRSGMCVLFMTGNGIVRPMWEAATGPARYLSVQGVAE